MNQHFNKQLKCPFRVSDRGLTQCGAAGRGCSPGPAGSSSRKLSLGIAELFPWRRTPSTPCRRSSFFSFSSLYPTHRVCHLSEEGTMEVDSGKLSSLTSSSSLKVTLAVANQLVMLTSNYYQTVANHKLTAETRWLAVC